MKFRRFFLALPLAAALGLALALPASAANSPVTVNVSAAVTSSLTITGLKDISFPAGPAGGPTETVTGAESYSVFTNNGTGFTLNIQPGAVALSNGGSGTIPNSALSVKETGSGGTASAKAGQSFSGSTPMMIDSTTGFGTQNYTEDWSLTIPGSVPTGTYTESFQYIASANP